MQIHGDSLLQIHYSRSNYPDKYSPGRIFLVASDGDSLNSREMPEFHSLENSEIIGHVFAEYCHEWSSHTPYFPLHAYPPPIQDTPLSPLIPLSGHPCAQLRQLIPRHVLFTLYLLLLLLLLLVFVLLFSSLFSRCSICSQLSRVVSWTFSKSSCAVSLYLYLIICSYTPPSWFLNSSTSRR